MKHRRTLATCIYAAALSLSLAACGSIRSEANAGPEQAVGIEAGQFTGPWAPLLTQVYENAQSDFTRRVLEDGVVTDQELIEMWQLILECTHAAGFTDATITTTVGPTGVSPVIRLGDERGDGAQLAYQACVTQYDGDPNNWPATLTGVNREMMFNAAGPLTHDQQQQAVLGCFQRLGLLPEGMTLAEYRLWSDPCSTPSEPADADRLRRAEESGCFSLIVPLDGRDAEEVVAELEDQGLLAGISGWGWNDHFFMASNPDYVQEAPLFLDGSTLWDNTTALMCFLEPNLDFSDLAVLEPGGSGQETADAYGVADCGSREPRWSGMPLEWWFGSDFLERIEAEGLGAPSQIDATMSPLPLGPETVPDISSEVFAFFHVGEGPRRSGALDAFRHNNRVWDDSGSMGTIYIRAWLRWCDCSPVITYNFFDRNCPPAPPMIRFADTELGHELAALYGLNGEQPR